MAGRPELNVATPAAGTCVTDNSAAQPLAGLVVVELGTSVAAPTATMILAELGAQVFKVENPRGGDDARAWGPPFFNGDGMNFVALNRNKRSVAIDLKNEAERAALRRFILARADIVVQNLRAGVVEKFKLDAASLTAEKPSLIYCNLAAFGARGPRADKPGYDPLMQAFGGIMSITGHDGDEPVRVGPAIIDKGTGMWLIIGALAALHRRTATGRGCVVDGSLYETALHWMAVPTAQYLASQRVPRRMGSENLALAPYRAFEASDGWLVIAAGNDGQFARVCDLLGLKGLAADERFKTNARRVANRAELIPLLAVEIAKRTASDLLAALETAGVPAGPVNRLDQVFADPQVVARGLRQDLARPGAAPVPTVRSPIVIDGIPCAATTASPKLGADTDAVLERLQAGNDPWLT